MSARSAFRLAMRFTILVLVAWAVHLLINWTMQESEGLKSGVMPRLGSLVVLLLAYALLIAVPFVPGVELGILLLMIEGAWIAPFIWLATLLGLSLAFLTGSTLPYSSLRRGLEDLRLTRAAALLAELQPLSRQDRLAYLRARLPRWLMPLARGHRYLLLALLINLPGNSVLGGGGGILMLAGFSRLFSPAATVLTIAIAVAPVPLVIYAFGEGLPLPGF